MFSVDSERVKNEAIAAISERHERLGTANPNGFWVRRASTTLKELDPDTWTVLQKTARGAAHGPENALLAYAWHAALEHRTAPEASKWLDGGLPSTVEKDTLLKTARQYRYFFQAVKPPVSSPRARTAAREFKPSPSETTSAEQSDASQARSPRIPSRPEAVHSPHARAFTRSESQRWRALIGIAVNELDLHSEAAINWARERMEPYQQLLEYAENETPHGENATAEAWAQRRLPRYLELYQSYAATPGVTNPEELALPLTFLEEFQPHRASSEKT